MFKQNSEAMTFQSKFEDSGTGGVLTSETSIVRGIESCLPNELHFLKKGTVLSPVSEKINEEKLIEILSFNMFTYRVLECTGH